MSGAKEIRQQIKSIQNTKKITRAMEMVAASKMRRAQERMQATQPYAEKILQVIQHLARSHCEYSHPLLATRPTTRRAYIIVSTNRGLCGGLNNHLFRAALKRIEQDAEHATVQLSLIGKKAVQFFHHPNIEITGVSELNDHPSVADVIGAISILLKSYERGDIDALYLGYNRFINTMSQQPYFQRLLPLEPAERDQSLGHYWDYIYEPDPQALLDHLLTRYIEAEVFQAVVENAACEQAARMVAMKSASDNASDLIAQFQLIYNKARQAAITQEIAEIVGGAAAV